MAGRNTKEAGAAKSGSQDRAAQAKPLVELRRVEKFFPGVHALSNAHLDLYAGEVHAVMGENGAGKSTLMKILTGVYQPDSGEIVVEGRPVNVPGPRAAQELGIGIIHQELYLMNHMTAAQNIYIGREPRRGFGMFVDEARLNADAKALFKRMKINIDPADEVGHLTVARQQLVEIAKALSFNSKVLIMDEPTSALNDTEVEHLFAIIADLKAHGVGIVYITHKMDEVKRIADRITVMRDGQTIDTLPAAGTPISKIISLMVGRDLADATRAGGKSGDEEVLRVSGLNCGAAVRDVGFIVRKGEILGFAGLMGAGRTEVARAIFGADTIEGGEIHVHGERRNIRSPADAVKLGIAYLSEDRKRFGLVTPMSVRDNITMASWPRYTASKLWMRDGALRKTSAEYVDLLKVKTPSVEQETRLLSGGNQQKIVIAKWLLRDCDILFFDEPTRGIDVGAKAEIYRLMRELADGGAVILMISSDMEEILNVSDRVAVMHEGRITGILERADCNEENVMNLAVGKTIAAAKAAVN